ncbi:MAG: hypothetical protein LQ349_008095, partial [Xanthoria aureola]
IKDQINIKGEMVHTLDVMNPQGMFMDGLRQREYSTRDMLPMSGKLIPEFDGRRNIKDMFSRKPPSAKSQSTATPLVGAKEGEDAKIDENVDLSRDQILQADLPTAPLANGQTAATETISPVAGKKRSSAATSTNRPLKRSRSGVSVQAAPANSKGQQSLKGFFTKPTATAQVSSAAPSATQEIEVQSGAGPHTGLEAAIVIHSNETESLSYQNDGKSIDSTTPTSPPATQDPDGSTDTLSAQTSPSKKGVGMEDSDKQGMLEQALHETGGTALRESRRAVQNHADEEERDELWKILLDVRATAGSIGGEGEEHSMAVSYFYLVQ